MFSLVTLKCNAVYVRNGTVDIKINSVINKSHLLSPPNQINVNNPSSSLQNSGGENANRMDIEN